MNVLTYDVFQQAADGAKSKDLYVAFKFPSDISINHIIIFQFSYKYACAQLIKG
jgi:hypothetical protein